MHVQLQRIAHEFRSAEERLHRLSESLPEELWGIRPEAGRWSAADCVDHLNRTSEAFLPRMRAALESGADRRVENPGRYRRDPLGWFLSVVMPPPVRFVRAKTSGVFLPASSEAPETLIRRFEGMQRELLDALEAADGLPLTQLRIRSPFGDRAEYNLFSCFVILPRHQHRHLWQAEQGAAVLRAGSKEPLPAGGATP